MDLDYIAENTQTKQYNSVLYTNLDCNGVKKETPPMKRKCRQPSPEIDLPDTFINLNELTKPLQCTYCTESFSSNMDYGLHSKKHADDRHYSCHLCDYKKQSERSFRTHIRSHDLIRCEKCKRIFKRWRCALKHIKTHTPQSVQCETCGKNFRHATSLKAHQRNMHDTDRVSYKCVLCNKEYKSSGSLRGHYSFNHRELGVDRSVICDICGKRLSCKGKLEQHIRMHTGDKPFPCTVCPKQFSSKEILASHMRTHTGEKPYTCGYCGKKFAHDAPYRYHIKTHTGEKSYKCLICERGFISRANMRKHVQTCNVPAK